MKKMAILAASSALIFAACSGDETTNVTEVTESTGLDVVAKGEKMPACDTANVGQMIFVTDSSAVYYCADGEWTTLNGKDGAAGKDGEDGKNGTDGKNGDNGKDGKDLVAVYDTVTTEFLNQEMLSAGKYGILVDKRNNKVYRTVEIGTQTWVAQNLNYTDGGVNSYCRLGSSWEGQSWCNNYGSLYSWADALNLGSTYNFNKATNDDKNGILRRPARGVCPEGFHVPDSVEFNILIEFVKSYNVVNAIESGEAASLKSRNGKWANAEGVDKATNALGFSAVATGTLDAGMTASDAYIVSNEVSETKSIYCWFTASTNEVTFKEQTKTTPHHVRCLKD